MHERKASCSETGSAGWTRAMPGLPPGRQRLSETFTNRNAGPALPGQPRHSHSSGGGPRASLLLTVAQHAVFVQRTSESYATQKRRAREAGQLIDYKLEDLRAYVLNNLGDRHCHYCRGAVTVESFALDHRIPIERGGSYTFHNLTVVCDSCETAKGSLDYIEFKELMELLRSWSPFVRRNFLARLQAGAPLVPALELPRPAQPILPGGDEHECED
jgi:5-methylcytosine-specific restriction endonuclease McrA